MKELEFGAFIKQERHRFVAYVRTLLRGASELDPEDVLHDVVVRLLGKPNLEVPLDSMTAYIYRSLRNRVVDHLRTRGRHVSLDEDRGDDADATRRSLADVLGGVEQDALETLQSDEGKRALFEALDTLSSIERDVVIAHELEGQSFKEIASRLRLPLNTLLSHKSRAMRKLVKHFQANKEEP